MISKYLILLSFVGFLLDPAARGSDESLDVRLSSRSVTLGDPLTLSVTIKGRYQDEPAIPDVQDLDISQGGTSSSVSFINGRGSREIIYSYYISAQKTGRYTIPSFTMIIEGKKVSSKPVSFEVLKPTAHVKSEGDNLPSIFVERTFSNTSPWEGEPVVATTKLFFRVRMTGASRTKGKSPDFRMSELEKSDGQAEFGGKTYQVIHLNELLIPLKTGDLKVPSDQFRIEYLASNQPPRRRSLFDMMDSFGRQQTVTKSLGVSEEKLTVKSLPTEGRPKNFSGLTGEFSLSSKLSTSSLSQGETATLTVEISGYGYLGGMKTPDLPVSDGFKVYPDKPEMTENVDLKTGLFSKRVLRYALVPLNSGVTSLGELKLGVFNPKKQDYEVLSTALGELSVQASKEEKAHIATSPDQSNGKPSEPARQKVSSLGTDLIDIYRNSEAPGSHVISSSMVKGLLLLLLLLVLGSAGITLRNRQILGGQDLKVKKLSAEAGRKYFKQRKNLFDSPQISEAREGHTDTLNKLVRTYLGEKFKTHSNSLTLKDMDQIFTKYGVAEKTKQNLKDLWEELDLIAYSGKKISAEETQNLAKRADLTIGEIEKQC